MSARQLALSRRSLLRGTAGLAAAAAVPPLTGCASDPPLGQSTPPPGQSTPLPVNTPLGLAFPPGFT